jgi:hypothetical protein
MLTVGGDRWTEVMSDAEFWQRAWRTALRFVPMFIPCAAGIGIGNLIAVFGLGFVDARISALQKSTVTELTDLVAPLLVALFTLFGSLAVSLWAIWQWMLKLTAYARSLCSGADEQAAESQPAACLQDVLSKRSYLSGVWLFASLYLLVPCFPLASLIAWRTVLYSKSPMFDVSVLHLPPWLFSSEIQIGGSVIACFLTIIVVGYTFAVLRCSANSKLSAHATATQTLLKCGRQFGALFTISAVVLLINIILTAPQMIAQMTPLATWARSMAVEAIAQTWLAIASVVVWPLSLAPYCRLPGLELGDDDV